MFLFFFFWDNCFFLEELMILINLISYCYEYYIFMFVLVWVKVCDISSCVFNFWCFIVDIFNCKLLVCKFFFCIGVWICFMMGCVCGWVFFCGVVYRGFDVGVVLGLFGVWSLFFCLKWFMLVWVWDKIIWVLLKELGGFGFCLGFII